MQGFKSETPNPEYRGGPAKLRLIKKGQNILWIDPSKTNKKIVLIGSHYDTKHLEDLSYVGANDSASSSVAIMNFLKFLNSIDRNCHYVGVWFDGEESVLHNWSDGERDYPEKIVDNTYGSRYFVDQLEKCQGGWCLKDRISPIKALILLDMIGSKNPKLSLDTNSDKTLLGFLRNSVEELGYSDMIGSLSPIEDDHIPFIKKGIPAVDIIDFENVDTWHTHGDHLENLSRQSILSFSKIAMKTAIKSCR